MGRKCQIEKLRPSCAAMDWTAIVMRESDPALEGDKLPQIDDGEFPGKAIELPAQRNRVLPGCKHAGEFPSLFDGDGRISRIGHLRCQSAMRRPSCTPQLLLSEQTAIDRVIEAPCRQFPNFEMLITHGNTSSSRVRAAAAITVAQ
jgi:hypothetical protein